MTSNDSLIYDFMHFELHDHPQATDQFIHKYSL